MSLNVKVIVSLNKTYLGYLNNVNIHEFEHMLYSPMHYLIVSNKCVVKTLIDRRFPKIICIKGSSNLPFT